jgi:hypothetical protein
MEKSHHHAYVRMAARSHAKNWVEHEKVGTWNRYDLAMQRYSLSHSLSISLALFLPLSLSISISLSLSLSLSLYPRRTYNILKQA